MRFMRSCERLFADPGLAHIKMEMIGVGGVVIWPENGAEHAAGIMMNRFQEPAFWRFLSPVIQHKNTASVCEFEAFYINGIASGMFAETPR